MLESYRQHVAEREQQGIPPLPLDAQQVVELIELIKKPPAGGLEAWLRLFSTFFNVVAIDLKSFHGSK